LQANTV